MRSGGRPSYIPLAENNMVTGALPVIASKITPPWTALADIRRPLLASLTHSLKGQGRIEKGGHRDEGPVASDIGVPPL